MNTFRDLGGISTFHPDEGEAYNEDPLFLRSVARTVAVMMAFQKARQPLSLSQSRMRQESTAVRRSASFIRCRNWM